MASKKKRGSRLPGITTPMRVEGKVQDSYVGVRGLSPDSVPLLPNKPFIINGDSVRMVFIPTFQNADKTELEKSFFPNNNELPPITQRMFFRVFCMIINIVHEQVVNGIPEPNKFCLTDLIRRLEFENSNLPKRNEDLRFFVHRIVQLLYTTECQVYSYSDDLTEIVRGHGGPTMFIEYDDIKEPSQREEWYTFIGINRGIKAEKELFRLQQRADGYSLSYDGPTVYQIRQMDWTAYVDERIAASMDYGFYDSLTGILTQNSCDIYLSPLFKIAEIDESDRRARNRFREKFENYVTVTYARWISDIIPLKTGQTYTGYRIIFNKEESLRH